MQDRRSEIIERLAAGMRGLEGSRSRPRSEDVLPTGIPSLDRLLPEGGVRRGSLVEWLSPAAGSGTETFALATAARLLNGDGVCLIVDETGEFHPPAAAGLGLPLERMLVVHPPRSDEAAWVLEQSLRCPGVALVVGWLEAGDPRVERRLQLAAEAGRGIGFLLRPARCRTQPSWADVRLLVEPRSREESRRTVFQTVRPHPILVPSASHRATTSEDGRFEKPSYGSPFGAGLPIPPTARPQVSPLGTACSEDGRFGKPSYEESWSDHRRLRVELLHCRGRFGHGAIELDFDDETGAVRIPARVAPPALARQPAGARGTARAV